eukprot:12428204-Alexandrium_andersonii.AAC.1
MPAGGPLLTPLEPPVVLARHAEKDCGVALLPAPSRARDNFLHGPSTSAWPTSSARSSSPPEGPYTRCGARLRRGTPAPALHLM